MSDHITRILAIRHGETAWNQDGRIQGHIDIPLNDTGRWQAQRMAEAVAEEGVDVLYTSDLTRAFETAGAIADVTGLPLTAEPGLRERRFGRFEGMTQVEVAARWPEDGRRWRARDPAYAPEGGETLLDFYERCVQTATRLASQHPGKTVALIAHGGVLDCFYRAANRVALDVPRTWVISNASINRLLYSPEGFSLLSWADVRHLEHGGLDESTDGALAPA